LPAKAIVRAVQTFIDPIGIGILHGLGFREGSSEGYKTCRYGVVPGLVVVGTKRGTKEVKPNRMPERLVHIRVRNVGLTVRNMRLRARHVHAGAGDADGREPLLRAVRVGVAQAVPGIVKQGNV
jgi:hypothetical protein